MPCARRVLWFLLAFALSSCGPPQLPTVPSGMTTPSGGAGGKYQCENVSGKTDPWLVEWDATQKARMQARSQSGVLLVRYSGCELEVLYGCEQQGTYQLVPTTPSASTEYITSEDDVFAGRFDVQQAMDAQGIATDARFLLADGFQAPRTARVLVKWSF